MQEQKQLEMSIVRALSMVFSKKEPDLVDSVVHIAQEGHFHREETSKLYTLV